MKKLIETALDEDKAEDVTTINLAGKSDFADYMIIASGRSQRHVSMMAEKLAERIKKEGFSLLSIEGQNGSDWVLVDCGDIIVHLFHPEARELYNLEKMWATPMPSNATAVNE